VFNTYLVENGCWWLRRRPRESAANRRSGVFPARRPGAREAVAGRFPDDVREQFREMLEYFGQSPIIVRSSSLLEDSYGNAFSGKYESVFCANQGTPQQRLEAFMAAVRTVYASTMSQESLQYRLHHGLLDRDEQMALLVQRVSGEMYGRLVLSPGGRSRIFLQPVCLARGDRSHGGFPAVGVRTGHAGGGSVRRRLHPVGGVECAAETARIRGRTRRCSMPSGGWTCWISRPTT
jgi:hypothetical protein